MNEIDRGVSHFAFEIDLFMITYINPLFICGRRMSGPMDDTSHSSVHIQSKRIHTLLVDKWHFFSLHFSIHSLMIHPSRAIRAHLYTMHQYTVCVYVLSQSPIEWRRLPFPLLDFDQSRMFYGIRWNFYERTTYDCRLCNYYY